MSTDYVICAAGEGRRMKSIVANLAKPLFKMGGRTLLERSIESLDLFKGDQLIFITQKEHGVKASIAGSLKSRYPYVEQVWIELEQLTAGQLATALVAKKFFRPHTPLVIFNTDTFFRSSTLMTKINDPQIDGVIPCSPEPGDAWSFCETGSDGLVTRVTEKERISDQASVGYYHFRTSELFLRYAAQELEKPSGPHKEAYVAPLYNRLIADGKRIVVDRVTCFYPMGTPEQFQDYWKVGAAELRRENRAGVIVVDLDATLTIDDTSVSYAEKLPNLSIVEKLKEYDRLGYEIIIHTARRMKTHQADESRVIADIGDTTLAWLKRHGVPFSGIKFGKPHADHGFYLDDRAVRPSEFLTMTPDAILKMVEEQGR